MGNAKFSSEQRAISVIADQSRDCFSAILTEILLNSILDGNSIGTAATSAKPSQPTTQVPLVPQTWSMSPGSSGSIVYSGLSPLHSDPTDPEPLFDPTIGDQALSVWDELVEVIGKSISFDPIQGCDVTEYRVRRIVPIPGAASTFFTAMLKRPTKPISSIVCECGSETIGAPGHSSWCPKHNKGI